MFGGDGDVYGVELGRLRGGELLLGGGELLGGVIGAGLRRVALLQGGRLRPLGAVEGGLRIVDDGLRVLKLGILGRDVGVLRVGVRLCLLQRLLGVLGGLGLGVIGGLRRVDGRLGLLDAAFRGFEVRLCGGDVLLGGFDGRGLLRDVGRGVLRACGVRSVEASLRRRLRGLLALQRVGRGLRLALRRLELGELGLVLGRRLLLRVDPVVQKLRVLVDGVRLGAFIGAPFGPFEYLGVGIAIRAGLGVDGVASKVVVFDYIQVMPSLVGIGIRFVELLFRVIPSSEWV